jgi:hypothetical protein
MNGFTAVRISRTLFRASCRFALQTCIPQTPVSFEPRSEQQGASEGEPRSSISCHCPLISPHSPGATAQNRMAKKIRMIPSKCGFALPLDLGAADQTLRYQAYRRSEVNHDHHAFCPLSTRGFPMPRVVRFPTYRRVQLKSVTLAACPLPAWPVPDRLP